MSSFVWIDHSEKQRRQVLDAVDLFREKDTRDELGLSIIRDGISDALFPGTGSLQTRARYFLFIPWMYLKLENGGATASDIDRKARAFEIALVEALRQNEGARQGVIGMNARERLLRTPASVYWNGLRMLAILTRDCSHTEYHRTFGRRRVSARDDDGVALDRDFRSWHTGLPPEPADFPAGMNFALTPREASYLKERVIERHRPSLFAFLLMKDLGTVEAPFVWTLPEAQQLPKGLARQVHHARLFSEAMNGAAILYNLWLSQLEPRRTEITDDCQERFGEWAAGIESIRADLTPWDLRDFWLFVAGCGAKPSEMSRVFVSQWVALVQKTERLDDLVGDRRARELVAARERSIKGPLSRFENRRSREIWQGAAGLGRMDFRWGSAQIVLNDISNGLRGTNA